MIYQEEVSDGCDRVFSTDVVLAREDCIGLQGVPFKQYLSLAKSVCRSCISKEMEKCKI